MRDTILKCSCLCTFKHRKTVRKMHKVGVPIKEAKDAGKSLITPVRNLLV
jgi:hypothetical protein